MRVCSTNQLLCSERDPPDTLTAPTNCFPKSSATKLAVCARVATCGTMLSVLPGKSSTVAVTVITSPGAGRSVRLRAHTNPCQAAGSAGFRGRCGCDHLAQRYLLCEAAQKSQAVGIALFHSHPDCHHLALRELLRLATYVRLRRMQPQARAMRQADVRVETHAEVGQ